MGQILSFAFMFIRVQFFTKLQDTKADLTGRTYLVTGSNTGLGLALAIHLARLNPAQLILAVRDLKKGEAAKEKVIAETGYKGSVEVWELDMASFESVKKFAERANTSLKRLDGAVLNAGINTPKWGVTVDGWERILQVNALSTGLLGVLLLPLLQATSKLPHPLPDTALPPHLTITGSEGMFLSKLPQRSAPKILETLNDESQCGKNMWDRYTTSKLFNLFLAREIAKMSQAQGVVVNVVAPGLCASELGRDFGLSSTAESVVRRIAFSTTEGALNLLYAVLRPTPAGAYIYACKLYKPPSWTEKKEGLAAQAKVWSEMVEFMDQTIFIFTCYLLALSSRFGRLGGTVMLVPPLSRRLSQLVYRRVFMSTRMSVSQPVDWKAAAPEPLPGTKTFAGQASLPLLPVLELQTTLTRLKESLKPLAWSEEELAAAEAKIAEFGTSKGPELHQRLLERSKHHKHWLEEWWDNTGYLGYRDSVVVNVSYYYGFDDHPPTNDSAPLSVVRAAYLARATMLFRQQYKLGLLEPEKTKEGPICMDTYRWMFDCCRVPGPEGLDWSVTYAKPGDTGESDTHIIVFRNNRPWKVQTALEGRILSTREIQKQIQHIVDNSDGEYPGVGVLSSNNRDAWAKDYTELASSPHNAAILQAIQSAAFTISLDSSSPTTPVHHSRALWHGDVSDGVPVGLQNRWVDKPVQYIVFENGVAGLMGEHSTMDGTPTVRLSDDVLNAISSPSFDAGEVPSQAETLTPTALDWQLSPTTVTAIDAANAAAVELAESQELGFHLTKYGKAAIKQFGVSPDSWAQMIVQLAYRRLLGGAKRVGGTYEAASTRRFFKGRTEAIRVVSAESDAWAASMDASGVTPEEKKKLFDAATKTHGALARAAGMGQGVDRHLFGLKKLLKQGEDIPALFTDPLFLRSSYWVLSTSAVFSKHFPVYGWGEVVPDGFGVAYMTGYDDRLQYTITSRKEMPNARFCEEIARAAEDLYDLHANLKQGSSGKPKL
ncbi:Carnitine acetyl transferase [Mycena venus]|uniref:Carnitine acetyl transferase n=1 Tax=Mycena venus TaxID=2733690 RepID=A0A8H6YDJ1_9AGAR|nr:Carnitine acetyl transferase [Mycena venus]